MPSSLLFAINNEGRVFGLSTTGTKWREFVYLGLEFKHLSAVPHFMWAVGGDRQVYVHVHGLDIPIRIKEESYENERWLPLEGFSGRLLPTDRYHFSSADGTKDRSFEKIRSPSMAWQWEGDWHLETTLDGQPLDHDGWSYAIDFPATFHPKKQWKSCVRRRKWIRYRRYSALNSWCAIAPLHKDPTREPFIDVAAGGQNVPGGDPGHLLVWAITAHGRVMFRTGVSTTAPEGLRWSSITVPPGCEVTQISVGPTGLVWAVLWNGRALVRTGVTRENPTGDFWLEIAAPEELKLLQVSVGTNAIWAVTRDHRVWFRKGVRGESAGMNDELAKGSGWVEMVGNMASVSVASNDQVWAVGSEDRCIYFRTGVLPSELTGKKWRPIHAPTQLSRTSSNASLWSSSGKKRGSISRSARDKRVRSWSSLSRGNASTSEPPSVLRDWEETSRSAPTPTSLRLQPALWQKSSDGTSLLNRADLSEESVAESNSTGKRSEEDIHSSEQSSTEALHAIPTIKEHSEGCVTELPPVFVVEKAGAKKSSSVWSPIRSVGSVVGMEVHAELDGVAFDPEGSGDSGVFGEGYDEDDLFEDEGDMVWVMVEAGACHVDPMCPPNWFIEIHSTSEMETSKPWRLKIIQELKRRTAREVTGFDDYEKAVEMSSWVKTGKARCLVKDTTNQYEDCTIELEWVGCEKGSLDSGTLTIMSPDKTHTKMQFSLSEITCVVCCSEPAHPRIAIHTPKLTRGSTPLKLEFSGDLDMEDWMANLTSGNKESLPIKGLGNWSMLANALVVLSSTAEDGEIEVRISVGCLACMGLRVPELPGSPPTWEMFSFSIQRPWRFSINLQCQHVSSHPVAKSIKDPRDVALHFNPRFEDSVIVRNWMANGEWGEEEREGPMVLKPGSDFRVDILCKEDGFKISVDGTVFTYFEHRQKPHLVTHVSIHGDITLKKVVYQSKMVIVHPVDMFWRQMGGHLRRVETCSAGVTWGIGYDCTAWVYTGGWGGSFLKGKARWGGGGLETSSGGINQMNDTHSFFVYENQRWNPLTGYTSHGLPTDRYMWSDVTGRHKRTREKTKLLSMHWQWVSDWYIDFHTPGGVDKEGWQYAIDFPSTYHGQKGFTDYVRRRRWVRKAQLTTSGPWHELGTTKLLDISLHLANTLVVLSSTAEDEEIEVRISLANALVVLTSTAEDEDIEARISVDNDSEVDSLIDVWAVAINGDALYRNDVSSSSPTLANALVVLSSTAEDGEIEVRISGVSWEHIPSDQPLASISCGPDNQVWAVGKNGSAYWRFGINSSKRMGDVWETVEPPSGKTLKQVSVGRSAVWVLDSAGQLSVRREVTPVFPEGTHWQTLPSTLADSASQGYKSNNSPSPCAVEFRHVSAGPVLGEVWAITGTGVVCRRIGGNWQHVSARGCNVKPQSVS
uniref:Galectin domain-containing protein n=1 Tax=Timema genevievae TaxID=629358 RepID=A0A7R9PH55_TIMGE|nr:unnamed protein product [Timema genevievae]